MAKAPKPVKMAAARPEPAPVAPKSFTRAPAVPSYGKSLKDSYYDDAPARRGVGTWSEAYVDYERHTNLAPAVQANLTRVSRSAGYVSGIDREVQRGDGSKMLIGLLGGSNKSYSRFSDSPTVTVTVPQGGATAVHEQTASERSTTTHGMLLGAYTSFIAPNGLGIDLLASANIYDLSKRALIDERDVTCTTRVSWLSDQTTDAVDYTLAANIQKRYELGGNRWWEPTAGIRFTYSSFGGNAADLGLKDGQLVRLQAGGRIGWDHYKSEGYLFQTSLGLFAYSDVLVDGYIANSSGLPPSAAKADEGKIRGLAQLQFKIDTLNGAQYYWQGSVRGGEDVIGATGKVGMRWEW